MARVLTGIQSSGRPHLGNILGAIVPAIELIKENKEESFIFIADLHSLISLKDGEVRKQNTLAVAAAWLAFGLDIEHTTFYRQSRRPEVAELTWYLNCFTPFPMLANAHSFKDKSEKLSDVNAGLFTYPVLMTSDILLYSADLVPVGKDQMQHLEMARDIASTFNRIVGEDILIIPEARIDEVVKTIPGTDGQKMSKSYNNYIDIFLPEKALKANINRIVTDSKGLEEPKDPDTDNVYKLYSLVASTEQTKQMRAKYEAGNYGYGHAKKEFMQLILNKYSEERKAFDYYMSNPEEVEKKLAAGEEKAKAVGAELLEKVRAKLGFK
ncbi:tryptophan--tRNA ligase [Algoriphagus antarcticus]|uniref:Tryptophan--tRNA ligase n=1 Tax=Algoriphagus antarcticus TaxID=238540 RepID=A0A3E0E7G1_9BACT|nr:tryptophan--tRNA ligase [Algoriphagus antarcticus]REG94188.1 tryptophanyl-tRNA synthetase [Algoriphagus antarcticus]